MKNIFIISGLLLLLPFCFTNAQESDHSHWKFGVSSGVGYRMIDTKNMDNALTVASVSPSAAETLYDRLKKTWILNTEAYYLIKPNWGLGLKYTLAKSSATLNHKEFITVQENRTRLVTTSGREDNFFHFVAPSFYFQTWINAKRNLQFVSSFALGYVRYRGDGNTKMKATAEYPFEDFNTLLVDYNENNASVIKKLPILPDGHTIGATLDVGMEYFFHKNWAVGANLSYFLSYMKKSPLTPADLPINWTISDIDRIVRLDLSIGISYYL